MFALTRISQICNAAGRGTDPEILTGRLNISGQVGKVVMMVMTGIKNCFYQQIDLPDTIFY